MSRLKVKGHSAVYHCVTRVVGGAMLLDNQAKEKLREQLWCVAKFCGVEILTYCIMTNHFHVLVRAQRRQPIDDRELLVRFSKLYGLQKGRLKAFEAVLKKGGKEAQAEREKLLARMGDVSSFIKELKQRFTNWYNRTYHRYGTLWAERFKSVLIEDSVVCLSTLAAYLDLNPVRAGLVEDPKDYGYCGYAEAVGGMVEARAGLAQALGVRSAKTALSAYKKILFPKGSDPSQGEVEALDREEIRKLVEAGGKLPIAQVLRLRVRYFSDGLVLGSKDFVNEVFEMNRSQFGKSRKSGARPMLGLKDTGLMVMRDLRKDIFS